MGSSSSTRLVLGLTFFVVLLLISGCVVSDDEPTEDSDSVEPPSGSETQLDPENEDENEIIASSITSSTELGSDLQIDVYALEDVGDDLLRLRFGVTNTSNDGFQIDSGLSNESGERTAAAITLLDPVNQNRHLAYRQEDGSCFCSELDSEIDGGDTAEAWIIFPSPVEHMEAMAVTTPLTPPIFEIPVTESSETVESSGLTEGQILPLTNISDDLEDHTGRTESDDEVSILLSSDVLFDTESADLSSEAQEILEQVATEIDDVNANNVSIDGHADNTGTDTINEPLSLDRAEAVESALADLVTSSGVDYEVEGHGSADPIATNDTEEGQERNRRVSVTFAK